MRIHLTILLSFLLAPVLIFAATNDFVADSNITVADVTFGSDTADMIIFDGSTSESFTFSSGTFTVINPGSAFQVGSSDSSVKSIQISKSGSTLVCTENTTPGTSYATLPTSSGTYTISPSATTDCTSLCASLSNTASYNSYPTCGAAGCNSGYWLSGSGASATCERIVGGGILGSIVAPISVEITVPEEEIEEIPTLEVIEISPIFTKTLRFGMTNDDVKRLQELLATDPEIYPEGLTTGYFGSLTRSAVQRFQVKYSIVSSGDESTTGYGLVGPKTRAKLTEVFAQTEPAEPIPSPITDEASQQQIQALENQIKQLQEQLTQLLNKLTKLLRAQLEAMQ